MPFVASDPRSFLSQSIGTGHCVALVREATGAPITTQWRRGAKAEGNDNILSGTAIATFDPSGRYGNHLDGRSHAAILIEVNDVGLLVIDQWQGQPTHERLITYRNGVGDPVNDGDQFFVVEMWQ